MIPSRKAREDLGRRPTTSRETFCKYCQTDAQHPQVLKLHVMTEHWGSTRAGMYQREEQHNAFMESRFGSHA